MKDVYKGIFFNENLMKLEKYEIYTKNILLCYNWIIRTIYIYFFLFEWKGVNNFLEGGSMKKKIPVFVASNSTMSIGFRGIVAIKKIESQANAKGDSRQKRARSKL